MTLKQNLRPKIAKVILICFGPRKMYDLTGTEEWEKQFGPNDIDTVQYSTAQRYNVSIKRDRKTVKESSGLIVGQNEFRRDESGTIAAAGRRGAFLIFSTL
jgi:hypothetical protein